MTCGMLCVMRRERIGVLHLDKYSPPKENWFGGKEERKREKEKKEEEKITDTNFAARSTQQQSYSKQYSKHQSNNFIISTMTLNIKIANSNHSI